MQPTLPVGYASGCTSEMGSVSGSGSYEEGATAVIKAVANEGYRFVKWDDDNTSRQSYVKESTVVDTNAIYRRVAGGIGDCDFVGGRPTDFHGIAVNGDTGTGGIISYYPRGISGSAEGE